MNSGIEFFDLCKLKESWSLVDWVASPESGEEIGGRGFRAWGLGFGFWFLGFRV